MQVGGYYSYIKKKYLRLFPAYSLLIIAYYVIGKGQAINTFSDNSIAITPFAIILNLSGLHGFSPKYINTVVPGGWYVGTIWIYICFAPLLYKIINNTSAAIKCMFIGLMIRIIFHLFADNYIETIYIKEWADMFILNQFLFLAIGQLLYFLIIKKDLAIKPLDHVLLSIMLFYITFGVDVLVSWALLFILIILLLANFERSLFINRISLWFGKYSYEIFLCHVIVQYYVCKMEIFKTYNIYVTLIITFVICLLCTSLIAVGLNKLLFLFKNRLHQFTTL